MRRRVRIVLGLLAALLLVAAACGDDTTSSTDTTGDGGGARPAVAIGAQDFGESAILAEIYKQALEAEGYDVSIQALGGFRDLEVAAFDDGTINFAPEYAASMLEFLNEFAGEATSDADETTELLQGYLDDIGLQALDPTDAIDTNAFVMTADRSEELGIETLSELAEKGADLTLGGPADCETNAFCIPGLKSVYDLDLSGKFQSLEPGAVGDALDAGAIDIGLIFSTDGRIKSKGWKLLEDDKGMLAADNIVPVVTKELAEVDGFADFVNSIGAELDTETLIELNARDDIDTEDAEVLAADWLEEHGFGS